MKIDYQGLAELATTKRLITEIYPNGIVSKVCDTYDLWKVVTKILPCLKEEIMSRDGRLVVRPDSGDPVEIVCGLNSGNTGVDINTSYSEIKESHTKYSSHFNEHEWKGVYELLWDEFGGTVNGEGYKVLDTHVGVIYDDGITLERQDEILKRLESKGFCASNLVLGLGSYSFAYCTRDTHGFAVKATWGQVDGVAREIYKDPITDDGMKKSAKGLLRVEKDADDVYYLVDQCSKEEEEGGFLELVFENGKMVRDMTLAEIRANVAAI